MHAVRLAPPMRAVLLLALALCLAAPLVALTPEASACIQVYPWSELCRGDKVEAAERIACWETGVCLP